MSEGTGGSRSFKRFEAEGWGKRAATYGNLLGAMTAQIAEPLLDAAGVRHDMRVLDIATGPGYAAARAAIRGAKPIGIDISEGMLSLARRRHPELEFRWGDAEELPFGDGSFGGVVGGFVLNHLPEPDRAAREAARVLTPGGGAAFTVWDRPERNRMNGLVADAVSDVGVERPAELEAGPDPYRFADDGAFEVLLTEAGFLGVGVETLSLTLTVPDADTFWQGFMGSSVRTRAVLDAQPEDVLRRIRVAFDHRIEAHRRPRGLEIPVVAKLGWGRTA